MKYALVITGVLAGLAITAPKLVILGFFLLIVPGLILTIAPTVFVYLAATALIRRLLPISSPIKSTTVAFGVALLLGWAVMQPFRVQAINAYHANELPDVLPGHKIELDGHVRLERPDHRRDSGCDYLSLALLDSRGLTNRVQSLTTVTAGNGSAPAPKPAAAYAIRSAKMDSSPGIFPDQPGRIAREYPPLVQANRGNTIITAAKAVEADWALRLAGAERLRAAEPVGAKVADWMIRIENKSNHRTSTTRRVTILDSISNVRYRASYRKRAIPARMFYFGFQSTSLSHGSFHVGRQIMETGQRSLKPEIELLQAIRFRVPDCDTAALKRLRSQATEVLDDPAAPTARIELARRYLNLFFFDTKANDHALISRIVADDRVEDIEAQIKNVFSRNKTPVAMTDAYLKRISMDHTSANLRHWLAECLANMPPGTFAQPDQTYLSIWNSPDIYQHAAPLIATLVDLGPDHAMAQLDQILDTAVELPHYRDRRAMIVGIREAFIRLGPQASASAPRIQELFLRRPSPIMSNAGEADQWRFALARMGVAIDDLPFFPNQSPQSVQRGLRQVANKIQRYEQEHKAKEEI